MTSSTVEALDFSHQSVTDLRLRGGRYANWPVVYTLNGEQSVYVGETLSLSSRAYQHLHDPRRSDVAKMHVVVDERFNKSACLDLESFLIQMFAGDGKYQVQNRNDGVIDADYFQRNKYRGDFHEVFRKLRRLGLFDNNIETIKNSDLFKLSPFKSLNENQHNATRRIIEDLLQDREFGQSGMATVEGAAGTGKTIVAIYLIKLLSDIAAYRPTQLEAIGNFPDGEFAQHFNEPSASLLRGARIGLVVPQQSLRRSIQRVFRRTPGLRADMVVTPFDVGLDPQQYDLLVVDETHRLNQRANQASGVRNKQFSQISLELFGDADDKNHTQIDWIRARSSHQIFLLDADQSVRPADVPRTKITELVSEATAQHRHYTLATQMRVRGGEEYVHGARRLLSNTDFIYPTIESEYDFRIYEDLPLMVDEIREREEESGLARLVAGYGFEWKSRRDSTEYDICIDGVRLRWNTTPIDWINSPNSAGEVGSIHTVQGYDLNYAGVIIGPELRYNPGEDKLYVDRGRYYDKKGKENNPKLGIKYSDEDLLEFVQNIYAVLMTRGMLGTYVYGATPDMKIFLRRLRDRMVRKS